MASIFEVEGCGGQRQAHSRFRLATAPAFPSRASSTTLAGSGADAIGTRQQAERQLPGFPGDDGERQQDAQRAEEASTADRAHRAGLPGQHMSHRFA